MFSYLFLSKIIDQGNNKPKMTYWHFTYGLFSEFLHVVFICLESQFISFRYLNIWIETPFNSSESLDWDSIGLDQPKKTSETSCLISYS